MSEEEKRGMVKGSGRTRLRTSSTMRLLREVDTDLRSSRFRRGIEGSRLELRMVSSIILNVRHFLLAFQRALFSE